jgi:NAD(P)-dependent dehydrogenase (short-subunit alcohol dehydrogenase family)
VHGESGSGVGHYSIFDINLTHPIRASQLAISRWLNPIKDSKVGKASPTNPKRLVHISSIAGQTPGFPFPLYIASKHAISGFIRSMAELDGTLGIRVNGVAPGIIKVCFGV